jgi:S1-C subfamily serine protease
MRHALCLLAITLILAANAYGQAWGTIIRETENSVVFLDVQVINSAGDVVSRSHGTGFVVISDQGGDRTAFVVTNRHVVEPALIVGQDVRVFGRIGNSEGLGGLLQKEATDGNADLAIMKFTNTPATAIGVSFNRSGPSRGSNVLIVGFPNVGDNPGLSAVPTDGLVQSLSAGYEGKAVVQIAVELRAGNSGGPIFDEDGLVVGVIFGRRTHDRSGDWVDNVGYAFPIRNVIGLLNQIGISATEESRLIRSQVSVIDPRGLTVDIVGRAIEGLNSTLWERNYQLLKEMSVDVPSTVALSESPSRADIEDYWSNNRSVFLILRDRSFSPASSGVTDDRRPTFSGLFYVGPFANASRGTVIRLGLAGTFVDATQDPALSNAVLAEGIATFVLAYAALKHAHETDQPQEAIREYLAAARMALSDIHKHGQGVSDFADWIADVSRASDQIDDFES